MIKKITNREEADKTSVFVRLNVFSSLKPKIGKRLKRMFSFLMLILISTTGFASGEITKLILQAKAQGSQFVLVNNLLIANTTFNSQTIQQEVVNPKYFDFNQTVALNLISNGEQHITLTLPNVTDSGDLVIDLIAVSELYYDFTINTSSGLQYSGRDVNLVHYRGVVRNYENESLVFLSISDEDVSMDISIEDQGEFEIYKDESQNIHVFYDYSDIAHLYDEPVLCGPTIQGSSGSSAPQGAAKAKETDKCLYLFMEVEYEVYLEAGTLDKLEKRVLTAFNKTAGMFENIGVTIRLRELKLWDTVDPYTHDSYSGDINVDWDNKKDNYLLSANIPTNVHLSQLLTRYRPYETGGASDGVQGGFSCIGVDSFPLPSIVTINGWCKKGSCMRSQVKTMAHEHGHTLSSGHTHDCHWNGDCTRLDNGGWPNTVCDGVGVGPCGSATAANVDRYWETVMSYNGGLKYWKGFRDQPGDKIRNFVNSQTCLSGCELSCNDLKEVIDVGGWAYHDVNSGDDDYRHSEIATNAFNEINAGGQAEYYSSTDVFLKPDFKANNGSDFYAAIKPCINYGQITYGRTSNGSTSNSDKERSDLIDGNFNINAYPNPTKGELVIELTGSSIYKLSVVNLMGNIIYEKLNVSSRRIELDMSDKAKGIYLVQVINQVGSVQTIKLVLE